MEMYVRDEEGAERLPKRSYVVLREALLSGELERGRIPQLIDTSERTARRVVSALIDKRLLAATSHKSPLQLIAHAPADVTVREKWLEQLFAAIQDDDPPYLELLDGRWVSCAQRRKWRHDGRTA